MKVLDLGCGDGTTAIPAAHLGADVLGVDIAAQPGRGRQPRARAAGLANLRFQEGDACDLAGLEDDSFDLVVSIFGAMFAPQPFDVAKEMVRVTRPGGRIVMGNWIPGDPTLVAQILKISAAYTPPPPEGFVSPMTWGVESHVVERFGAAGIPADKSPASATPSSSASPGRRRTSLATFRDFYGPTMNAFDAAAATAAPTPCSASSDAVQRAEPERRQDQHPRDLPQGHGRPQLINGNALKHLPMDPAFPDIVGEYAIARSPRPGRVQHFANDNGDDLDPEIADPLFW